MNCYYLLVVVGGGTFIVWFGGSFAFTGCLLIVWRVLFGLFVVLLLVLKID